MSLKYSEEDRKGTLVDLWEECKYYIQYRMLSLGLTDWRFLLANMARTARSIESVGTATSSVVSFC